MKRFFALALCGAVGLFAALPSASAQQKTVKACQEEWQSNKKANQAAGVTQKAYVDKCRAAGAAAQPATKPAAKSETKPAAAPTRPAATKPDAPQKTVNACEEEWRANRAANQAAGVTQKAYVEKCRAGNVAAQPAVQPVAVPPPKSAAAKSDAPQKTVKACEEEWRANKAANQKAGITQKAYVEKCRAGSATAQPAPAPTMTPAPAPARPAATTTAPAPAPAPAPARPTATTTAPATPAATPPAQTRTPAAAAPTGAGQFTTEVQAKASCPRDTVVWVNLDSKIYHFAGYSDYGKTKSGAYMCEGNTAAGGFRAAKNEKHP